MTPGATRSASARERARRRPLAAQVVLKMIATKASLAEAEAAEMSDERWERVMALALEEWDRWLAMARERFEQVTESELAEAIVAKCRREPKWGWARILRVGAN